MPRPHILGFTLIELLIACAVLGVLASIAMPLSELNSRRQKEAELRWSLREIREALDAYRQAVETGKIPKSPTESGFPATLETLAIGVSVDRGGTPVRHVFLRRIPRDPMATNTGSAAATWGTRSYASTNDNPVQGRDVFDVYSKSTKVGLNGVPYRDW